MACKLLISCLLIQYIIINVLLVDAKVVEDSLKSSKNWIFLSRFCFLGGVGKLHYEVVFNKAIEGNITNQTPLKLLIYSDEEWSQVYPHQDMACSQKESILDPSMVRLVSSFYKYTGCSASGDNFYNCSSAITFGANKERWWYIAIANCASKQGLDVRYKLTMINDQTGNKWFEHFSADEFYILQSDIAFLVVYILMTFLSVYVAWALIRLQFYHRTYKLYMATLVLEFLSLVLLVAYWSDYSQDGQSKDFMKYCGRFLEYSSTILFVVLLILLGKGYTITRGRIRPLGVIKLLVFTAVFIVATIAMFIWEATSFDPGQVLYIYDSAPGYCLVAIRLLAWFWFGYSTFFTLKKYTEKRLFYLPLIIVYTIWFWAGPIMVFVAIDGIPKWAREKLVNGLNLFIVFIGHLVFLILTWPTKANQNFPFYVTTSQITNGEIDEVSRGNSYALQERSAPEMKVDNRASIFTTDMKQLSQTVNVDEFPHETVEYIERRDKAMELF